MNRALKSEPDATLERCEERVAFWTETERKAREAALRKVPGAASLLMVASNARKTWGEALEVVQARARQAL